MSDDAAKEQPNTDAGSSDAEPTAKVGSSPEGGASSKGGAPDETGVEQAGAEVKSDTASAKDDSRGSAGEDAVTGPDDSDTESTAGSGATVKIGSVSPPKAAAGEPVKAAVPEAVSELEDAAPGRGVGRKLLPIAAAFVAGAVLVAAVATAVLLWRQDSDRGRQLDARDASTSAACDFGKQIGTYDAKNFDDYVQRVKVRSTGDWATQFDAAAAALKYVTTQAGASSTVGDIHCAWESGDLDNASIDLLITQIQTKAATPQPQRFPVWAVASMQKKDGKWLASDFKSPLLNEQGGSGAAPGDQAAPGAGSQGAQPPADQLTPPTPAPPGH
jgi:Mce-associated membrane protein